MFLVLSFNSALEYWLSGAHRHYPSSDILNYPRCSLPLGFGHSFNSMDAADILNQANLSGQIHLMIPGKNFRPRGTSYVWHVVPEHILLKSYIKISDFLYVASPEFTFLQCASFCTLPQLVLIANAMCGTYVINENLEGGMEKRNPISTVNKISSYLVGIEKVHGIKKARQAIKYALNNSASPIEGKLAAMLTLPIRLGGYGFELPQLNMAIVLNQKAAEYLGQQTCFGDIVWKNKIIIEYDSLFWHLDEKKFIHDKKRSSALQQCGYKVFQITPEQLKNFSSVENLMSLIRKEFSKHSHIAVLEKYLESRLKTVISILSFKPAHLF